jgi:apoptosis-inducing factor 2
VGPLAVERTVIPHDEYLTHAKVVTASATGAAADSVGRAVAYDFLVIATGRTCARPPRLPDRLDMFHEDRSRINLARSVMIVGGRPIGVELAAEIVMSYAYPDKKSVTLVHGGDRLLKAMGVGQGAGVAPVQGRHRPDRPDHGPRRSSPPPAGETVKADCYFVCTGRPLASAWQ